MRFAWLLTAEYAKNKYLCKDNITMKYICAQPRLPYYAWQLEVMILNFLEQGVQPADIHILLWENPLDYTHSFHSETLFSRLYEGYPDVNWFEYSFPSQPLLYPPSMYFTLVMHHFRTFPDLQRETFLFHDCDTILLKPLYLDNLLSDDAWYCSDTVSYIGSDYILSKGSELYNDMCAIVGIDPYIPIQRQQDSGGAQYLIKNSTFEFWQKVAHDSVALYSHLCKVEPRHYEQNRKDYPIQKWTAGMWALLWNAWACGHEIKVTNRLDFCVATDPIEQAKLKPILHNAQVLPKMTTLFQKEKYKFTLPYYDDLSYINKDYCSYLYAKSVEKAAKITKL